MAAKSNDISGGTGKKRVPIVWLFLLILVIGSIFFAHSPRFLREKETPLSDLSAEKGIVVDLAEDRVLWEKRADEPQMPASLTKLMALYPVLDDLKAGKPDWQDGTALTLEDVSGPGSMSGVRPGQTMTAEELVAGVTLASGCDCIRALARMTAGSEEALVERMNEKARTLGLEHSHFKNATGLDDPEHVMSARDIALLCQALLAEHPELLDFTSLEFWNRDGLQLQNLNELVGRDPRVLGLKTGTTPNGGNHLVTYCREGDREYLIVLLDCRSPKSRFAETTALMDLLFEEE